MCNCRRGEGGECAQVQRCANPEQRQRAKNRRVRKQKRFFAYALGFAVEMTFCFVIMKDAEGGPTDDDTITMGGDDGVVDLRVDLDLHGPELPVDSTLVQISLCFQLKL